MKMYGLIGYPLSHSFSEGYFAEKFKKENISGVQYKNFPISTIDELPGLMKANPDLAGLNVTIPYKEEVMAYLDDVEVNAREVGAVNTIRVERIAGSLKMRGFNTDTHGFSASLQPFLRTTGDRALILGTGGAAKAVAFVFKELNIYYRYVSRTPNKQANDYGYHELDKTLMEDYNIIVNTSPVGMYPDVDKAPPIPYEFVGEQHLLYDLIYNPPETLFLKKGKERGTLTKNGLEMLELQAEKSWDIWNLEE